MAAETPAAPLEKAVEEAREALATVAARYPNGWDGYDTLSICTTALRSLLAALPGESEAAPCPDCDGLGYTIEQVGVYPDGSAEPGQRKCDACDGTGDRPAPALSPEVWESAERVRSVILRGAETGERDPDSPLGVEGAEALLALLRALAAAPAPEPSTHALRRVEVKP